MKLKRVTFVLNAVLACCSSGSRTGSRCKCFPGDACWPSKSTWDEFNATIGGRLIATELLAAPCHDPNYDVQKCAPLRDRWRYSGIHMQSSSFVMAPYFQGCDALSPPESPCTLGNYVAFTVNASTTDDIVAALKYAREQDIRIVIRNTGHDYLGRSTGAGALAIWTHHFKHAELLEWRDNDYEGKALKVGAGVQGFEALAALKHRGLVIVTGECPTVGVVGGYLQGGGHSGLSTTFGLAADNVLSFDVVSASGELLTASRRENQDLYWALAGGGGGSFGAVTSATLKAHPDAPVAGATFGLALFDDKIFDVVDVWHAILPRIVDAGVMVIYSFGATFLEISALTAYNKTATEVQEILQPFVDALAMMNVSLKLAITEFRSYHDHYEHYWGPLPEGNIRVDNLLVGGRLIPRGIIHTTQFGSAAKDIAKRGAIFIGVGTDVSRFGRNNINAVLPQWRSSVVQSSLFIPWNFDAPREGNLVGLREFKDELRFMIEAATLGAGAYMNEADFEQPDWQATFYGNNYERLLEVKKKYDPDGLLYVVAGVGSEEWKVGDDGRLCHQDETHDEL